MKNFIYGSLLAFHIIPEEDATQFGVFCMGFVGTVIKFSTVYLLVRVIMTAIVHGSFT